MPSSPPLEEKKGTTVQKALEWVVVRSASCNESIAKINCLSWTDLAHVFLIGRDCSLDMWLWNWFGLRYKLAGNTAVLISAQYEQSDWTWVSNGYQIQHTSWSFHLIFEGRPWRHITVILGWSQWKISSGTGFSGTALVPFYQQEIHSLSVNPLTVSERPQGSAFLWSHWDIELGAEKELLVEVDSVSWKHSLEPVSNSEITDVWSRWVSRVQQQRQIYK